MNHPKTIEWIPDSEGALLPGRIRLIDQTKLPGELVYLDLSTVDETWEAIKALRVRGAPAIGIAAAMGVVLAVQHAEDGCDLSSVVNEAAGHLATSRPTAVNLFWALDRMQRCADVFSASDTASAREALAREAIAIRDEDEAMCRSIGEHGVELLEGCKAVLTHCNAGSLATAAFGTALAPIYVATERGARIHVYADETRPLLQGARLTAWELMQAGVDVTLICDNTAAQVMKEGRVDAVLVGADRIAANGDAANKIGTYGLALLARAHNVPFYVLAPSSTIDIAVKNGEEIPIEQRGSEEVTEGFGSRTAPEGVDVYSPAFDVTPAALIAAIVCEQGIARLPFDTQLQTFVAEAARNTGKLPS